MGFSPWDQKESDNNLASKQQLLLGIRVTEALPKLGF